MRRLPNLPNLLTLLAAAAFFTGCGGGGGDAPSNPSSPPADTVASVRLTQSAVQLGVGQTVVLKAEALAANGAVLPGKTFVFSSSDDAAATVSPGADTVTIKAMSVGTTIVTAGAEGKTAAASVTVTTARAQDNIPVTGRVVDGETGAGIAGAVVSYQADHGQTGAVATAGDGSFSLSFLSDGRSDAYLLDVTANATGYVSTRLSRAQVRPAGHQIESVLLVRTRAASDGTISGAVLDVRKGFAIAQATVRLERGQGSALVPEIVAMATSDAQGRYAFSGLAAGTYTVVAQAIGYVSGTRTAITVSSGGVAREQNVGLSPLGAEPEIRIVLNWGSAPEDLDAHLTGPNAPGVSGRFHAYYANRLNPATAPHAGLDLDDRDGSGPETITLTRLNGGVYRYSVHDYTNGGAARPQELGRSGAAVLVIAGTRSYTFHVPNQPGNLWTVFEMAGDIGNPVITERGEMGMASDEAAIP
ncbi:MAG: carboxypeptidase regulatory-like domain-containing protein [Burkholderiales bacterium]|nr:carboxypeptidase regulatory-like domain-containing protein [Burkholderiales bacterium]